MFDGDRNTFTFCVTMSPTNGVVGSLRICDIEHAVHFFTADDCVVFPLHLVTNAFTTDGKRDTSSGSVEIVCHIAVYY